MQDRAAKLMMITACTKTPMGFGSGVGGFVTALREMGVIATNNLPDPTESLDDQETNEVRKHLKIAGLI